MSTHEDPERNHRSSWWDLVSKAENLRVIRGLGGRRKIPSERRAALQQVGDAVFRVSGGAQDLSGNADLRSLAPVAASQYTN